MRRLELTESARADLKSIHRYSIREWGVPRTALYLTALSEVMKKLVAGAATAFSSRRILSASWSFVCCTIAWIIRSIWT